MNGSISLRDATAQEIQCELIRRTKFNNLDGERVLASLLKHRDLWLAALLDRPGLPDYSEPDPLLMSGLVKLRDLPRNIWNVDQLFIMTQTHEQAREVARIAEEEDWIGEVCVYEDQKEIDRTLGTAGADTGCCRCGGISNPFPGD